MIDYNAFLEPIVHPNKKKLAISLIANSSTVEDLYKIYGEIRVKEMQKQINRYNKDPEKYFIYKGSCDTCGV